MRQNLQLVSVPTCQIRVAQPIAPGRLLRRDSRAGGQPIPLLRLHQFCILGPLDSLRIAILARAANTGCTARIDTETGVGSHPNDRWLGVTTLLPAFYVTSGVRSPPTTIVMQNIQKGLVSTFSSISDKNYENHSVSGSKFGGLIPSLRPANQS